MNSNVTDDSPPSWEPELFQQVTRLELDARRVVEGLVIGRHKSPFFGRSLEFVQHRAYVAGDDPRHLDWKVWAKSDRYTVKQYEEETNLRATLLVDTSASMAFPENGPTKLDHARRLAAAIAYMLVSQSDAVGLVAFDHEARRLVAARAQRPHLRRLLAALFNATASSSTDFDRSITQALAGGERRGLIVLISDLFTPFSQIDTGLRRLRQSGHDVIVIHLLADEELDFPYEAATRFESLEDERVLPCDPKALRSAYLESLREFLTKVSRRAAALGVDYRLTRASESPSAVLAEISRQRQRARR